MTWLASSGTRRSDPVLVLNGSEARLQLALGRLDGEVPSLSAFLEYSAMGRFVEVLAPALEQALGHLGMAPGDLAGLACVSGPGSFTGLRLTMALAQGMAAAGGQLLAGLPTLPLLAAGPVSLLSGEVWVLTRSRRSQVYAQGFAAPQGLPLGPAGVFSAQEAAARLAARPGPIRLLGSGLREDPALYASTGHTLLPPAWDFPDGETLLAAAASAQWSQAPIEPVYLRGSDAEENLAQIAAGRGLSLEEARAALDRSRLG